MSVQLVSKISNLCDHNPPTSQTDGQTDRRTTCDPKTAHMHYSALRGKKPTRTPCWTNTTKKKKVELYLIQHNTKKK